MFLQAFVQKLVLRNTKRRRGRLDTRSAFATCRSET